MATDAARARGSLPAPLTSFLGRRSELARVKTTVQSHRLVTIVGAGGVGKTRLALEAAYQLARSYPNGCWFIELGRVPARSGVLDHVASALGMTRESGQWSVGDLAGRLAGRKTLLLFDNCEHVIDEVADVVDGLLRRAPEVDVLATSRQALGVAGEVLLHLDGLSFPDATVSVSPGQLAGFESVALFVERARSIVPQVELGEENAEAIADIARRLEGVPLAIELAAVRMRVLSPRQIATRLADQFRLLGAGRGLEPRHHTLRAAIEWSYDLCSAAEQLCWARLSVFPADFDIEAAEAVVAGGDIAAQDVLEIVGALVDKSILRTGPSSDWHRAVRYSFPESMREFGREAQARTGSADDPAVRHLQHFRLMAEAAPERVFGPAQVERMEALRVERPNLEAARLFAATTGDSDASDELACAIAIGEFVAGALAESAGVLESAGSAPGNESASRVRLLWLSAWLAITQGDVERGRARATASREMAERIGDEIGAAHADQYLGHCDLEAGDSVQAGRRTAAAVATARLRGDANLLTTSLVRHAQVLGSLEDWDAAEAELREAIGVSDEVGELWCRSFALRNLALLMQARGRPEEAEARARQMLDSRDKFHDQVGIAEALEVMAWCAADLGEGARAAVLLGAAGSIWSATKGVLPLFLEPRREACELRVRAELGEPGFAALWRSGASMRPEEALMWSGATPGSSEAAAAEEAPATTVPPSLLTPREREVAELVTRGLKNREIAELLVISTRTAEAHVEHILTKLGFTSRAQISSWEVSQRAHTAEPVT